VSTTSVVADQQSAKPYTRAQVCALLLAMHHRNGLSMPLGWTQNGQASDLLTVDFETIADLREWSAALGGMPNEFDSADSSKHCATTTLRDWHGWTVQFWASDPLRTGGEPADDDTDQLLADVLHGLDPAVVAATPVVVVEPLPRRVPGATLVDNPPGIADAERTIATARAAWPQLELVDDDPALSLPGLPGALDIRAARDGHVRLHHDMLAGGRDATGHDDEHVTGEPLPDGVVGFAPPDVSRAHKLAEALLVESPGDDDE